MTQALTADVGEGQGAPASPSSERADHPAETYITRDQLREELGAHVGWLADQTKVMVAEAFRGNMANFDRAVSKIASDLGVSQQKAAAILEEMGNETIGADRVAAKMGEVDARTKAEQDAAKLRDTEAQLDAERAARRPAPIHPDQRLFTALWDDMKTDMEEMAEGQGLTKAAAVALLTKESAGLDGKVAPGSDYAAIVRGVKAKVRTAIKAQADAQHREREAVKPELDTTTGGGNTGSDADFLTAWGAANSTVPQTRENAARARRLIGL